MTTTQEGLYEEIDLRPYIETLVRNWMWIVGSAVAAAVLAFAVTSLLPPQYEATALVAITKPRYSLQFDPRIQTLDETPAYSAYPELATSDDLMQALFEKLELRSDEVRTPFDLKDKLTAETVGDQSLLHLTVTNGDPETAARIANEWAALFVTHANQIYGNTGEGPLTFLETQMEMAEADLAAAQQALIDFQARNRAVIVRNRLTSHTETQADYLEEKRTIASIIQDARGLRSQFAGESAGRAVTTADQLTALLLQIQSVSSASGSSLQLQVDSVNAVSDLSPDEQVAFLDGLIATLEEKNDEIDVLLAGIEPQILADQRELQEIEVEEDFLRNEREIAQQTYLTLARKVEEARIASQDLDGVVQLASKAAVPQEPMGSGRLINAAAAGIVGLIIVAFVLLAMRWWQEV